MVYHGCVISDIHIGAKGIPLEKMNTELDEIFFTTIQKQKKLDYLIIDGDLTDSKFYLNDRESQMLFSFCQKIKNIALKFNTKVRIVYGTDSHEWHQYDVFESLKDTIDIDVIYHVKEEELFPDMWVLYLPEEQIYDKKEFYESFFQNKEKYSYVFGHGVIREAMKEAATQLELGNTKRKKVPVFTTAELRSICKGQVYFGHYHVHTDLDDIYYVGSFSRWKFGEDDAKGFYLMKYNQSKESYENEFIENSMADVFQTIRFGYENKVFKSHSNMEDELNRVDSIMDGKLYDHVRFEFNIPEEEENPEAMINYVNERYKFNDKVKVNIVHGYVEQKKKQQREEIKKESDKYSFIFDHSKLEEKVSNFIQVEYNKKIKEDRVAFYLYQPLSEIIKEDRDE